ncbi:MAG: 6-carboxytetrahydropterin synthase QueD [Peptococcaceae bacterium]|nr:6-carboxytetrahydropterin synthase QueD [Peptococcaceae bacterium]
MFEIAVKTRFAAAHFLSGYKGPCASLHGHTWQVEVTFKGQNLDHSGMLLDFKAVKEKVRNIVDELDHVNLNDLTPFQKGGEDNPTAENLARYIYRRLKLEFSAHEPFVKITAVRVWESPDASASYLEE